MSEGRCAWKYDDGIGCSRAGTISLGCGEPAESVSGNGSKARWYCSWHYECLAKHLKDDTTSDDYRKWYDMESTHKGRQPIGGETWNPDDELQMRGLAILGPGTAWQLAPPLCRKAAEKYVNEGKTIGGDFQW